MVLNKNFSIILLLFILSSCSTKKSNDVIAYNQSNSIQLTKKMFDSWLQDNPEAAKNSYMGQIESYFIQKSLLAQNDLLGEMKNDEIDFISELKGLRKARGMIKESWNKTIEPDQFKVDELYSVYKKNYDNKEYKVRLYQIFKRFPPNANEQDKLKIFNSMVNFRNSVDDLNSFKRIAQKESNSQTRLRDGLIGNIGKGIFDPDLEKIVLAMNKDEISDVIKTKKGYVLFYCEKRVPKVERQDEELYDIAYQNIFSQKISIAWPEYQSRKIENLNINYDWDLIISNNNKNNIITSDSGSLNHDQLLWVLNEDINHYKLSEYNKDTIERRVEYYLLNRHFYSKLNSLQLDDINYYIKHSKLNSITSAVLLHLIHNKLDAPSDQDLKQYYLENMSQYQSKIKFDYSYITFNLENKNKLDVYKNAENVLYSLNNNLLNFSEAVNIYSAPELKLRKESTGFITQKKSSHLFGINVTKQLKLMKVNQISDLIESDSGYLWILRLNKIQNSKQESFLEAKEKVHQDLGNKLIKEIKDEVYSDILISEKIEYLK